MAKSSVAAVILAAGSSTRMGRPKQLLRIRGRSLIRRIADEAVASSVRQTVVVTGAHRDAVLEELAGLPVTHAENDAYLEGMSTSVREGLRAIEPDAVAAVVLLADQPFVDRAVIDALIDVYTETGGPIVQPRYGGTAGNPVLWDRSLFGELIAQEGDQGGREILARRADQIRWCELPNPAINQDVDTPSDFEAIMAALEQDNGGPFSLASTNTAVEVHSHAPSTARFCPSCGRPLREEVVQDRLRPVCTACGAVFWVDPKVAVATVIPWGDGVLLGRRAIDPGRGRWSFPSGYVDRGEDVEQAARREVLEETGLDVEIAGLVGVYSAPGRPVVLIVYAGEPGGDVATAGSEMMEVAGFPHDRLPDMAFEHDEQIIEDWMAYRRRREGRP